MARLIRFVALLVVGLGLVCWATFAFVVGTTRTWLESDVELRARAVVSGAHETLVTHWTDPPGTAQRLTDISRDERIMGVATCGEDGTTIATSEAFPHGVSCRTARDFPGAGHDFFGVREEEPGGAVHLSIVPVDDGPKHLGYVLLVHDLSYAGRREDATRNMLLGAFFLLAMGAVAVTLVAARLSWRDFALDFRRALRGEKLPAFLPLLRDVRELAERLSSRDDADQQGARWTPERLKATLEKNLEGERIIVVANREPYVHEKNPDGSIKVMHPASGLVTALEPVMRACSGVWVAHGSGSADRETSDATGHVRVPPGEESYVVRRVWLSEEEESGYYYGFANEGLWPLCHLAHTRPVFRAEDFEHYRAVNQRFADVVCSEAAGDDPIILVQDYHFALAPRMIRQRLPRATILTFWHIPWPNPERFGICPWRNELIEGILGSSIVGFHTRQHCNQFLDTVDAFVESRIDHEENSVVQGERHTLVRPYPISIEWPLEWLKTLPTPAECRAQTFAELGLPPDALLGLGVDRLDYTKGIEERLLAVERLLERFPAYRGKFTFAQLAAPSRTRIERYKELNDAVERIAARVNERFGSGNYRPIALLRSHHERPTVYRYYRAANLCYVSSLHDGMNLVAKEFVAARTDEQGVLLLSQFTGASRELTEALIVNPYDLEQASSAMDAALRMTPGEQRDRIRAMRKLVAEFNVYRWVGRMLVDAAQIRRRDRLEGRLSHAWMTHAAPVT